MTELTLHIQGMSCGHCLNAVNKALADHPGLEIASVQMGRAEVRYDPEVTDAERIIAGVREAGYEAAVGMGSRAST